MQEHYGLDLNTPGLLDTRSGRWLRARIVGLLDIQSRTRLAVFPPKQPAPGEVTHGTDSW